MMNTWNTLPESYQQGVYNNTLATVKRQIQQAENPTPAVVISVEPAQVKNAILIHYFASKVALAQPEIGSTDQNIPIHNNCTDNEHHFGMPGGSRDYKDEGDENDVYGAIPTAGQPQQPTTELERFDLGTSNVDGYEGIDGDNADADEEEDASQADGSTQNVEDRGDSRFDLGTSDVDGYESKHASNDADADEEEYASQADNGSTLNVGD
jgi:hypothetical protein